MKISNLIFIPVFVFMSNPIGRAEPRVETGPYALPIQSLSNIFNSVKELAMQGGKEAEYILPRKIRLNTAEKLVLSRNQIYFNGKELRIGEPLSSWKDVIPGKPRCIEESIILCLWDDFGLVVGTADKTGKKVRFMNLYLNFMEDERNLVPVNYPDGRPAKKLPDYLPHRAFSGYLEIEDVGVDAKSEFGNIQRKLANKIAFHCGLHDCSHPISSFGNQVDIYLRLNGGRSNANVLEVSLSATD